MTAAPGSAPASTPAATPAEVFERLVAATLANSADEVAAVYAPDVVIDLPFGRAGVPLRFVGREPLRERWAEVAVHRRFTAVDEMVVRETADPEVVVGEFRVHAEVTATGTAYTSWFLMIMRVRDGLIVSSRDFGDPLAAAAAFGRLPELVESVSRR